MCIYWHMAPFDLPWKQRSEQKFSWIQKYILYPLCYDSFFKLMYQLLRFLCFNYTIFIEIRLKFFISIRNSCQRFVISLEKKHLCSAIIMHFSVDVFSPIMMHLSGKIIQFIFIFIIQSHEKYWNFYIFLKSVLFCYYFWGLIMYLKM